MDGNVLTKKIQAKYDTLRKNNIFKTHSRGFELFTKMLIRERTPEEIAIIVNKSRQGIMECYKRYELSELRDETSNEKSDRVILNNKIISKVGAQEFNIDKTYTPINNLSDLMDPSSNALFQIALRHKMIVDETTNLLSDIKGDLKDARKKYEKKVIIGYKYNRKGEEFPITMNLVAYTEITDKLRNQWSKMIKTIEPYLNNWLERFSNLHEDQASDVVQDQADVLKKLVKWLLYKYPGDTLEIMGIVNGEDVDFDNLDNINNIDLSDDNIKPSNGI